MGTPSLPARARHLLGGSQRAGRRRGLRRRGAPASAQVEERDRGGRQQTALRQVDGYRDRRGARRGDAHPRIAEREPRDLIDRGRHHRRRGVHVVVHAHPELARRAAAGQQAATQPDAPCRRAPPGHPRSGRRAESPSQREAAPTLPSTGTAGAAVMISSPSRPVPRGATRHR